MCTRGCCEWIYYELWRVQGQCSRTPYTDCLYSGEILCIIMQHSSISADEVPPDLSQFISQTVSSKQQEVRSINWWYYEMLVIATSQQMCATNLAELKTVKMEMDQSKEFPVSLHEGWLHCMTLWLLATRLRHCRGYKDIMEQRIEFKKPFY